MRWAVPSSKVGSRESASAAAERDSGVDTEGLAGGAWAGAGLACTCAAGGGAGISLWPKAGTARRRTAAGTTNWRMNKIPKTKGRVNREASTADLKSLLHKRRIRSGTSDR